jgi:hypothetical protein
MNTVPAYIQEFATKTGAHPSFIAVLCAGLEADFLTQSGHTWPRSARILPHLPDEFSLHTNQMLSWVEVDLFLESQAVTTMIVWGPENGSEAISPSQEIEKMTVHWDHLPMQDIHEILGQMQDQPFEPDSFGFALQYEVKVLPHVQMEIHGARGQAELINETLSHARNRWNAHDEGLIHSMSKVEEITPGVYSVTVDLGSAVEDGLLALLTALDQAPIAIDKVIIGTQSEIQKN